MRCYMKLGGRRQAYRPSRQPHPCRFHAALEVRLDYWWHAVTGLIEAALACNSLTSNSSTVMRRNRCAY
jgi:hypothetical protein